MFTNPSFCLFAAGFMTCFATFWTLLIFTPVIRILDGLFGPRK